MPLRMGRSSFHGPPRWRGRGGKKGASCSHCWSESSCRFIDNYRHDSTFGFIEQALVWGDSAAKKRGHKRQAVRNCGRSPSAPRVKKEILGSCKGRKKAARSDFTTKD